MDRGVRLDNTYQLNFGGNSDFFNMLERERLYSKKISKTGSVTSQVDYDLPSDNIHIGPSDYVPWLSDRKWAYIRLEGTSFGDVPLNVELKLEVHDSPNSAGVVIDAIRCAKIAKDRGMGGPILAPLILLYEIPAGAVHRRRSAPKTGRIHRRQRVHHRRVTDAFRACLRTPCGGYAVRRRARMMQLKALWGIIGVLLRSALRTTMRAARRSYYAQGNDVI